MTTALGPTTDDPLEPLRRPTTLLVPASAESIWGPVVEAVHDLGLPVRRSADGPVPAAATELVWIFGSPGWYPRAVRSLLELPAGRRPLVVVWHTEPLPTPRASGLPRQRLHARELAKLVLRDARVADPGSNLRRLLELAARGFPNVLIVTSLGSQEALAERGLGSHIVPIGALPGERRDLGLDRDIDVLFLGAAGIPRRKSLLRELSSHGGDVHVRGSWTDPELWGEARTRLLSRVRILLNLSRYPGQFSGMRLVLGMGSGALVVSEPIYRPDPFVPGRHFVSGAPAELPALIAHYLEHEQERRGIADEGRRFVHDELTFERSVAGIADAVAASR